MARIETIDGVGTAVFGPDGRVRLVVAGDVADLFDRAAATGVSADELAAEIMANAVLAPLPARAAVHEPSPVERARPQAGSRVNFTQRRRARIILS